MLAQPPFKTVCVFGVVAVTVHCHSMHIRPNTPLCSFKTKPFTPGWRTFVMVTPCMTQWPRCWSMQGCQSTLVWSRQQQQPSTSPSVRQTGGRWVSECVGCECAWGCLCGWLGDSRACRSGEERRGSKCISRRVCLASAARCMCDLTYSHLPSRAST